MRTFVTLAITLIGSIILLAPSMASAATPIVNGNNCQGSAANSAICQGNTTGNPLVGPNGLLGKVTRIVAVFGGAVAVIMIMVGGLMYVLSDGDSGKISNAKNTVVYALVGLVVIGTAQSIIIFVIDRL